MNLKEKFTKKFWLTKILPMCIFVIITTSVVGAYYYKMQNNGMQLLEGQTMHATKLYSSYMESEWECIKHRVNLAASMAEEDMISDEDICKSLLEQGDIQDVAIVDASGTGIGMFGDSINLPAQGLEGLTAKDSSTYFYAGNGIIYILDAIVKDGEIDKILLAEFDTKKFDDLFTDFVYSGDDWLMIQDENGKIIYSFHGDVVDYLQTDSDFSNTLSNAKGKAAAVISGIKKQHSGSSVIRIDSDERMVTFYYIKNTGWTVMMGLTDTYFDAQLRENNRTIHFMILSLAGCLVLFIIIIIMNSMLDKMSGKKRSAGLMHLAETDQLTGLYNKVTTERKIKEFIEENPETQSLLFVLDIDDFKKINDTMGHAFGDEVLREIGQGLKQQFRASDIIGRAGGDEFIILLKNLRDDEIIIREAQKLENFFKGLQVGTYTKYSVTSSIGCAVFYRDGDSFEKLYKQADEALYKAKHRGKNQLAFYKDPEGIGQNV